MSGAQVNNTELTLSKTSHLSLPEQALPPPYKPTTLLLFSHSTPALAKSSGLPAFRYSSLCKVPL